MKEANAPSFKLPIKNKIIYTMTKLQLRAFIYQLGCFAILFISFRYLIFKYTNLTGLFVPFTAFVVGTILSPKFQAVKTKDGEKLFMSWLFVKGIKEL
jgi:hypothetical protein